MISKERPVTTAGLPSDTDEPLETVNLLVRFTRFRLRIRT